MIHHAGQKCGSLIFLVRPYLFFKKKFLFYQTPDFYLKVKVMKHTLQVVFILLTLIGMTSTVSRFEQRKNNTKATAQLNGDDGILLRIDIEYAVNKRNVVINDGYVQYTVTNIGTVQYNGNISGKKNAIVFDLTTKENKIIEKPVSFLEVLSPGKSTVIKYFIADVGPKASCIAVKPSRLDYWSSN